MKYPVYTPSIGELEKKYVNNCLDSTWVSSRGEYLEKFESLVASYVGTKHAIAVFNGTVALHLALLAYDISSDDEVIIPDFTYIATANAVTYVNAKVVLADVDKKSWNITLDDIKSKFSPKTKAVIVTDIYGTPPEEMNVIKKFCKENSLILIEDAAESLGATYQNQKAGALADIATLSFFGNKTITTGEGGMVLTNDDEIAAKLRKLKNQGNSENIRYYHDLLGYNYRMTNIQAAIGTAQIERIDEILQKKREVFNIYKEYLNKIVNFQNIPEFINSSYWMVSFTVSSEEIRNNLSKRLLEHGIDTRPFFYPVHEMPFYEKCNNIRTQQISKIGLNVPSYPNLSEKDIEFICKKIIKYIKQ